MDKRGHRSEVKPAASSARKPLPIGVSDYRDACKNYYYVDKTLMIKEFLDERPKVSLFTRPRRFGTAVIVEVPNDRPGIKNLGITEAVPIIPIAELLIFMRSMIVVRHLMYFA